MTPNPHTHPSNQKQQRPSYMLASSRNGTDHIDVLEAGEDQVLQQLAADSSRSHHQNLAAGQRVGQLFPEGTHKLDHVDIQDVEQAQQAAPGWLAANS